MGIDSVRNVCVDGTVRVLDVLLLQSDYVETWSLRRFHRWALESMLARYGTNGTS